ncbi:cytochrome P450 [Cyanobium sp. HWJ4-Hawea]|uniref:cytochrome P450 n=1 Tax=Cyanobium sp. HWJ4-Hawea TaxID=2823713 RepID=UPI0020CDB7CD|nr:cytochrome P450 [Cyanobium sp. HWJ4-Hawea]MCP9808962.1 cytochrome P450 [Cyanobium sp. HWJ4-Hawea]
MSETSCPSDRSAVETPIDRRAILSNPAIGIAQMAYRAGGIAASNVLGNKILQIADALLSAWIQYDRDDFFCRSRQQKQLNSMFGTGLLTEEGRDWAQIHDSVNNSFTRKNINKYHEQILDSIDANIGHDLPSNQTLQVQLGEDTVGWSVATISTVLFGKRLNSETISQFLDAFLEQNKPAHQPGSEAKIRSPFARLLKSLLHVTTEIEKLLEAPVQAALKQDPQQDQSLLLDINDELKRESRCPFSQGQNRNLVKTLFMAGIQTSSYTLDWTLLLLAKHPQHWQRLAEAIRPQLGNHRPSIHDFEHLKAVHNVIGEVLRMRPVIPTIQKGVTKPLEMAGINLKPGDTLNLSIYGIHNSSEYWQSPESFRPERFESELRAQTFTPFGLGQHTCIGQHLAMHILTTTLIRLVQQFDIVADDSLSLETESTFLLKPLKKQNITLVAI